MSVEFKSVGGAKDTSPFSADPDPNTSAPLPADIFEVPDRTVHGEISFGVKFFPTFTNPSGAGVTVDIRPWLLDETSGVWASATAETGILNNELLVSPDLAPGRLFFQKIAQGAGTVDFVEIFAAPA